MTGMAGKASGRCRGADGVVGRFSTGFGGYVAAKSWRDGQTQMRPRERARWSILERDGHTWALPPGPAEQAAAEPWWTPEWPDGLLPILDRIAATGTALLVCDRHSPLRVAHWPADGWHVVDAGDGRTLVGCPDHAPKAPK